MLAAVCQMLTERVGESSIYFCHCEMFSITRTSADPFVNITYCINCSSPIQENKAIFLHPLPWILCQIHTVEVNKLFEYCFHFILKASVLSISCILLIIIKENENHELGLRKLSVMGNVQLTITFLVTKFDLSLHFSLLCFDSVIISE